MNRPSRLYGPRLWSMAMALARVLPASFLRCCARGGAALYCLLDRKRRRIVEGNLRPMVRDESAGAAATRTLFDEFARKLVDLWRFEAGCFPLSDLARFVGTEHLDAAFATRRGVLLVTLHLGNWELGAAGLSRLGRRLLVLTQAEPGDRFTERRQAARAALGIDTLVVGGDSFGFVEVIRRLSDGGVVALLIDRPPPGTGVAARFLDRDFQVSRAPAELARASGCVVLPVFVVREREGYRVEVLPAVPHERRELGTMDARVRFSGEILRAFEPILPQYVSQWFHFVPIWPEESSPPRPR